MRWRRRAFRYSRFAGLPVRRFAASPVRRFAGINDRKNSSRNFLGRVRTRARRGVRGEIGELLRLLEQATNGPVEPLDRELNL